MFPYNTALITGGNGNIGRLIAECLVEEGVNVIRFDVPGSEPAEAHELETFVSGDIRDVELLERIFRERKPDIVYHLASLLSGSSEADLEAAWEINATASFHLMKIANTYDTRTFFFASTVASYGSSLPEPMPEETEQWPENFYGVTKVAVERLGVYFKTKRGVDFRCLRFPMVISPFAPTTAVTAYPSHAIKSAVCSKPFVFPVSENTGMSTLFLNDVISSIIALSTASRHQLSRDVYSLHAYFFTAKELVEQIQRRYPDFECTFSPVAQVEQLLSNWPNVIIDDNARSDWGWQPEFDFSQSLDWMFEYYIRKQSE